MKNQSSYVRITALLLTLTALSAFSPLQAQLKENKSLTDLAQLFLGKWTGEQSTSEGKKFESTLEFSWTLNKNFIKVDNLIRIDGRSELAAVTTYGWQPVLNKIVFWSFDKDGAISEGVAALAENVLSHQWRSFGQNGEIKDWRSTLTRKSDKKLVFTLVDQKRRDSYTVTYTR